MAGRRGLVVSPPIKLGTDGSFEITTSELDPQELRFSLLFWDVLDFPSNNVLHFGLDNDAEFLFAAGVLQRTTITVRESGEFATIIRKAHLSAFDELDAREPGTWSLATGPNSVTFWDEQLEQGRGTLVALHRAIPVPDKDVHLADVLKFKEKRTPELLALRTYLDDVYLKAISATDRDLAVQSEITRLDQALADYIKSTAGVGLKFRLSSQELYYNADIKLPLLLGAAAMVMQLPGADIALAAIGGTVFSGSSIGFKGGARLRRERVDCTPYKYVSDYHRELF